MSGRVELADAEIVDAVAATEGEMLELLARLVEAPTTLGNEEPGQVLMTEAFRQIDGLAPFDIPMDEDILHAHPRAAPFDWDVRGKRNVVATNHQGDVEWHEHARATKSLERERLIAVALGESEDPQSFADAFLRPTLYSASYESGMGTLYTAVYRPARGAVEYRWPNVTWEHSFERFREGSRTVRLLETTAA